MTVFASRSVGEHLGRGMGAAGLITAAVWLLAVPGVLRGGGAVLAFVGAVVLMRGCPTCWVVGLVETIGVRTRGGA